MTNSKMYYLDTHAVIYLYGGDINRLSKKVTRIVENNQLLISPIVILELDFLYEINRIKSGGQKIINTLSATIGLQECNLEFIDIVKISSNENWTRDPFDRLIVSNAIARNNSPLITQDRKIVDFYSNSIW